MDEDTTGEVVVQCHREKKTASVVLKFTMELIGQATMFDRPIDADLELFVRGSHKFMNRAMSHATEAVEVINYAHVWPHFGIERKRELDIKPVRRVRR